MGRKHDGTEMMKQRSSETIRVDAFRQAGGRRQRSLRHGLMLCLGLVALHSLALGGLGQGPWPTKVNIEVAKPVTQTAQYRSDEKEPRTDTDLEFNGTGNGQWSFVYFDKLPNETSLKTKDQLVGYDDSEVIRAEKWYWFKNKLPLTLRINSGAPSPIKISFWFGSPKNDGEKQRANQMLPTEIRAFTENKEFQKNTDIQTLEFSWVMSVSSSTATSSPAVVTSSPTIVQQPESSWMTYLTEDDPLVGYLVLALILILFGLFIFFGLPTIVDSIKHRKRTRNSSHRGSHHSSPLDSLPGGTGAMITTEPNESASTVREPNRVSVYGKAQPREDRPSQTRAGGAVVLPTPRSSPAPAFNEPAVRSFQAESNRLEQMIKDQVGQLTAVLNDKANRSEQERLVSETRADLENKLAVAAERFKIAIQQTENLVLTQSAQIDQTRSDLITQVSQADQRATLAKQQLGDLLHDVLDRVKNVETHLQARLDGLQTALDRQTVPDSFFNKTLGAVLGQNVETLQAGNFERLIGEKLNQFFETGVERGEKLQELRLRAEGINAALKEVAIQMEKINPKASAEARQSMQRVEDFVNELSGLQSQMQSRRATIETILRVPVSMHAGARQTFLDELGRGIRREIEKLNDPVSHFESELERLITADLIAIVDICDKTVAPPPGSRPDLEAALTQVFEQAGLRAILPSQGQAFKTGEQDLIEMAQGGGGQSLTVAQVVTRGFYYLHGDGTTLLRKAGVTVFR